MSKNLMIWVQRCYMYFYVSLFFQQWPVCKGRYIITQIKHWFPLVTWLNHSLYLRGAEASDVGVLMEDLTVCRIAKDHNKTPAHVLLKFLLQRGLIVLPKSVTPERVKANIEVCIINKHSCHCEASDLWSIILAISKFILCEKRMHKLKVDFRGNLYKMTK